MGILLDSWTKKSRKPPVPQTSSKAQHECFLGQNPDEKNTIWDKHSRSNARQNKNDNNSRAKSISVEVDSNKLD
jgi:hypothetical protein